jgi:hypothetical protein
MVADGPLLALIRGFLEVQDEVCLARLLDDIPPADLGRLTSELGLDQRAAVLRLLASRGDGTSPVPS